MYGRLLVCIVACIALGCGGGATTYPDCPDSLEAINCAPLVPASCWGCDTWEQGCIGLDLEMESTYIYSRMARVCDDVTCKRCDGEGWHEW